MDKIIIKGAREHNLKNINLELPRNKLIVFTGISGSGKSTLAFDTIFAEGQRRYLESLSSYARQFLGQMDKPDVDHIEGLSPTIAIDQKTASHNPRSTVGTITEIHDYLRLLYAKIGIPHCSECGKEIVRLSTEEIAEKILEIGENKKVEIIAPIVRQKKGEYSTLLFDMFRRGFSVAYVNGRKYELSLKNEILLERYKRHDIDIVVDETEINSNNITRIFEAIEKALKLSGGLVKIRNLELLSRQQTIQFKNKRKIQNPKSEYFTDFIYNQKLSCSAHDIEFPELEPRLFSFNSPFGACPACEGLGSKKEIDPKLVIPEKNRTIAEGAILPWSYKNSKYYKGILRAVAGYYRISENTRLCDLSENKLKFLLYGNIDPDHIPVKIYSKGGNVWKFDIKWKGVVGFLQERYFKTDSDAVRQDIEKYMSPTPCSVCKGSRYKPEALLVKIHGKNISEISGIPINETLKFFQNLKLTRKENLIAGGILREIIARLGFLNNVGLDYLTLSRSANTLAGGETQRIRLASQIGSQLTGVLYILDEPSIGLHARDNHKLLETLKNLRNLGNTVIVIEHDEETIREADHLVDIGPEAGKLGGKIVAEGTPSEVMRNKNSLTAKYLRGDLNIVVPKVRRPLKNKRSILVRGASENNLKSINVEFPLKTFTCVTGVSGSGKSTLVDGILYKALSSQIMRSLERPGRYKEIIGTHYVDKVIMIDQSPIGRTPRSNPATYTGLFSSVRELFSKTKDAKMRGYSPSRFSFNVTGGRCDNCAGEGFLKIEMQFMPDVYLPCDVCRGSRYNSETLQVKYKGKNIAEVLSMTVAEAADFFVNFPKIHEPLKVLEDVGLGYIGLGQAATTFSGGEAQRIKLASELSRLATGNTLYILDEPTTGLHFEDIKKLLGVLNKLVDAGNTVIVIEHNLDVIKSADWIIDLGPEGGDLGGRVVVVGTPEEVIKYHQKSYTAKFLREVLRK